MSARDSSPSVCGPVVFGAAFGTSPIGLAVVGVDGTWLDVNPRLCAITGYDADTLRSGMTFQQITHPDDVARDVALVSEVVAGQRYAFTLDKRYVRPDGTLVPVRITVSMGPTAREGDTRYLVVQIEDRTEVIAAEHRFETLLSELGDMVGVIDAHARWLWASPSFDRNLGFMPTVGERLGSRIHPDDTARLVDRFAELISGSPKVEALTFRSWSSLTDDWVWLETVISDHRADPAIGGFVVSARDVTERVAAQEALRFQASRDPLTMLANRSLLLEQLERAAERSRATGRRFLVAFFDLDHFKTVNDTFGHRAGDELLVTIASRLRSRLRRSDTIARLGGDEFVVVAEPGDEPVEPAIAGLCGAITDTVTTPICASGRELHTGASIGVVVADGTRSPEELLRDADVAMYEAKAAGRGQWMVHEQSMSDRARRRFEIGDLLRTAVPDGRVRVLYQPVVDAATGQVRAAEALCRLTTTDGTELPPGEFIPIAEETGAIRALGAEVLRQATRAAARWADESRYVAVNVSARQLSDPDFEAVVADALEASGLAAARLVLEVTESAIEPAGPDVSRSAATVERLHRLGVRFALDDFGTGHSSVDRLRRLPVFALKIDQSFVARAADPASDDISVIRAVVGMADALGIAVIAEGVETDAQAQVLTELGSSMLLQGYRYGRPAPTLPA